MQNPEIGKSITAGGVKTNYHDEGNGFPAILIHGSGPGVTAWANWRFNIPVLSDKMRVLAPDMLGFGYTERPSDGIYSMERWCAHLIDFADALGLDTFDIVGNSYGGALAISMAANFPDRVRRIVLMGAAGVSFPLTKALDEIWGYEPSIEAMQAMLDIFAYDRSLIGEGLAELRYKASIQPGFQEAFSAMFPAPRQNGIEALATPEDKISQIECPALIIHGREDVVLPSSNSIRLFELLPNSELHMFGKCGHWTQIEHKNRFNMLVTNFLTTA